MILLGYFFEIRGLLYSGPLAEGLAFLIALVFLIGEIRKLNINDDKCINVLDNINYKEDIDKDENNNKNIIITIAREYGSGGRYIGKLVADKLGIKLYDNQFINKIAEDTGFSDEYISENEQKRSGISVLDRYYYGFSNSDELFDKEAEMIKNIASRESCVIIGRCANFVLKDFNNVINIFIYNSELNKIKRVVNYYNIDSKDVKKKIDKINKLRENHYKYYTDSYWKDSNNYDIRINSNVVGVEKAANLICELIKNK